ncbi:MAG: hypothetical protein S4CHLAM102_08160 [Chlamydiia bacterium]|nr:hypothetical protein [Chlamydiia bacterium]
MVSKIGNGVLIWQGDEGVLPREMFEGVVESLPFLQLVMICQSCREWRNVAIHVFKRTFIGVVDEGVRENVWREMGLKGVVERMMQRVDYRVLFKKGEGEKGRLPQVMANGVCLEALWDFRQSQFPQDNEIAWELLIRAARYDRVGWCRKKGEELYQIDPARLGGLVRICCNDRDWTRVDQLLSHGNWQGNQRLAYEVYSEAIQTAIKGGAIKWASEWAQYIVNGPIIKNDQALADLYEATGNVSMARDRTRTFNEFQAECLVNFAKAAAVLGDEKFVEELMVKIPLDIRTDLLLIKISELVNGGQIHAARILFPMCDHPLPHHVEGLMTGACNHNQYLFAFECIEKLENRLSAVGRVAHIIAQNGGSELFWQALLLLSDQQEQEEVFSRELPTIIRRWGVMSAHNLAQTQEMTKEVERVHYAKVQGEEWRIGPHFAPGVGRLTDFEKIEKMACHSPLGPKDRARLNEVLEKTVDPRDRSSCVGFLVNRGEIALAREIGKRLNPNEQIEMKKHIALHYAQTRQFFKMIEELKSLPASDRFAEFWTFVASFKGFTSS